MALNNKPLDCSDIDRYIGKPLDSSPIREPLANNDIRRWAQAMHYPNLLHFDPAYSAAGRWGRSVAPQSFAIAVDDGHGAAPACVGCIKDSHLLFGGDEWWFYGTRIFAGDMVFNERVPFDYAVKETKFAGSTCFQRGDNHYRNQQGEMIAKQRSTAIRYRAEAGSASMNSEELEEPAWSDIDLQVLEDRKLRWIQMLHDLGHKERWWNDVKVDEVLTERVFGLHSIASFTTEWRAYLVNTWGTMNLRKQDLLAMGFTPDMAGHENDPEMQLVNPEITDGAYIGPSRGHLFPRWARKIGMPRAYGYRGPALAGDITIQTEEVVEKMIDQQGRSLVQVKHKMANQKNINLCTGTAEIELPMKPV
jgi:hypothetical protein